MAMECVDSSPSDLSIPEIPAWLHSYTIKKHLTSYAEAKKIKNYRRAAHVCLWARLEGWSMFGRLRGAVMMQLRFDGTFGFPGGLISEGEDVVEGLNRELMEEIAWNPTVAPVTWNDYYNTQVDSPHNLVLHFFIKQLTLGQFCDLEKACPQCSEYGKEVMGSVRVPLYTMHNMYSGLPAFLNNKFTSIAKEQLLLSLYHVKLLSEEEVKLAILHSQADQHRLTR
ncbi:U8 snoRNA-decapping enzyme-like [Portunus trituberculatus]|nr:U8 snoRNA-decapping enzyme-like [Portunus trituberculatus]